MKNLKILALTMAATLAATPLAARSGSQAFETLKLLSPVNISFPLPLPPEKSFSEIPRARLQGEELFQYLHEITEPKKIDATSEYTDAKSYLYSVVENVAYAGKNGLFPVYSGIFIPGTSGDGYDYKENGDANRDGYYGDFINCEHIWPQSFFNENYPMRADLHHLYPSLSIPNNKRANFSFAELSYPEYSTICGAKMEYGRFEPCQATRGNVARVLFYFIVRYYDRDIRNTPDYKTFWTDKVPMLLRWNREDPPDSREKKRNDAIEKYQGNRNPFIDAPELADRISAEVFQSH